MNTKFLAKLRHCRLYIAIPNLREKFAIPIPMVPIPIVPIAIEIRTIGIGRNIK